MRGLPSKGQGGEEREEKGIKERDEIGGGKGGKVR